MESELPANRKLALQILELLPAAEENAFRLGITGVPGVGKSTFIEAFGKHVIAEGHRVAVLAVDPSSARTGGSILGDKTRMSSLGIHPDAFIRPSASGGSLGGVTRSTYGTIRLCEAAGYDFVIVETVGVGQSEIAVSRVTDFMLLLMLAGAGDELQGVKRGIMEMADAVVITKADSGNERMAAAARAEYGRALHLLRAGEDWSPPVLTCSSVKNEGIAEIYKMIRDYSGKMQASGAFSKKRSQQSLQVLEDNLHAGILKHFYKKHHVQQKLEQLRISGKSFDPFEAASDILREAGFEP